MVTNTRSNNLHILGPFGQPSDRFGVDLGCHEGRLGLSRAVHLFVDLIRRSNPSKWLSSTMPANKKWPRIIHPRIPLIPRKWRGARAAAPNPTSLTPGVRIT